MIVILFDTHFIDIKTVYLLIETKILFISYLCIVQYISNYRDTKWQYIDTPNCVSLHLYHHYLPHSGYTFSGDIKPVIVNGQPTVAVVQITEVHVTNITMTNYLQDNLRHPLKRFEGKQKCKKQRQRN